ncbi:MAG: GNAT family N-acetyltransferase [Ahrensia sp.]|nr:GNAT family N-acetyltransferase [Ahrensia sp.]
MAQAALRESGSTQPTARTLDYMDYTRMGRGLTIHNPSHAQIEMLIGTAREKIEGLADTDVVLSVYEHNPDSIFVVTRKGNRDGNPTGVMAQLPLNKAGHDALFDGTLDTVAPDLKYVAQQHEVPSAIYSWCMVLDARTAGGISLLIERFSSPKNIQAPIYCRPATPQAAAFFKTVGFTPNPSWNGLEHPDLMEYQRKPVTANDAELIRSNLSSTPDCNVSVVHSFEEFHKIVAVRAATYMAEHDCPYDEEFDGNDFSCTHMLGTVDGEAAGCIRIRYFASFAKIERLAVLQRFRRTRLAENLIRSAISLCRKKGYRHIYGHCEPRVRRLWMRHGFVPRTKEATFGFSSREYLEGDLILDPANDVLTPESGPLILNRPEGDWATPGILERG